jgi:nucleoside-diphosphate-sugar epimerase
MPKSEDMIPNPKSPYAVTKITGEYYVKVFATLYGMETASLRYFNVFGPRQDPTSQYSGVIAKFVTAALNGAPFIVYGDGMQARDFTYVENVVNANVAALKAARLGGDVMNVACGGQVSLLEMIEALRDITGTQAEVRFEESRAGDVKFSQAAIDVARQKLDYEPSVSFREGLKRTVDWYRVNPSGR